MSESVITASPSLTTRRSPTRSEMALLDLIRRDASWIWTQEDSAYEIGDSPPNEQRAFRKTHAFPASKGTPSNVTIMVAADDYFAMYLNGVLIQPPDPTHDFRRILAYHLTWPLVEGGAGEKHQPADSMLLGFRVIQKLGWAGLMVAAQVEYESSSPDVFFTGSDQSWVGERTFDEHWEQPWFTRTWKPAIVIGANDANPERPAMEREEVMVFGRLPIVPGGSSPSISDSSNCQLQKTTVGDGTSQAVSFGRGEFAGMMVGSVAFALLLGGLGVYLVMRRRMGGNRVKEGYVATPFPTTEPGRQVAPYQAY